MKPEPLPPELARFLGGEREPAGFHHRDHVGVAYELLRRHPLLEAAPLYAAGLQAIALRAGKPGLYNETITLAFLSLIAERMEGDPGDFEAWLAKHPELLDRSLLQRWYRPERLNSPAARRSFLLPDPIPH